MKFLSQSFLHDTLKIPKNIPILYVEGEKTLDHWKRGGLKEFTENAIGPIADKNVMTIDFTKILERRPFDEMVMVSYQEKATKGPYFLVLQVKLVDGEPYQCGTIVKAESLHHEELNEDHQKEWLEQTAAVHLAYVARKKSVIHLAEAPTRSRSKGSKKIKYKKSKVIIVSDKYYLRDNIHSVKVNASYAAHSVCGHVRNYYNEPHNPASGHRNVIGQDRHGNMVSGWTWIAPYSKGEGAEIMEKIRIYK